jgi:heat shock protein HtpX
MANIYNQQDSNVRKTWYLMTGFFIFIIMVGWAASWIFMDQSILYVAIAISIFGNIFSYWYSDKIVLRMAGARPVSRESHIDLWNITENLSIASGLPMPKLYTIDDPVPNAFATGRNEKNSAVAVTTGLLGVLDRSELEGVVAHELAHVKNKDILLQTIVVTLVGFLTLLGDIFLRSMAFGGGRSGGRGNGNAVFFVIGLVLIILSPIIGKIIQLSISRKREFLADASGALMTRYPEGLASALEKISNYGGEMRRANHATAHLYIVNSFGPKKSKTGFMNRLFLTHPPVEERIRALRGGS